MKDYRVKDCELYRMFAVTKYARFFVLLTRTIKTARKQSKKVRHAYMNFYCGNARSVMGNFNMFKI